MNVILNKNCSFREWYDHYKLDIIQLFHIVIEWIEQEELYVYYSKPEFYNSFVHFVYKNSIPFI